MRVIGCNRRNRCVHASLLLPAPPKRASQGALNPLWLQGRFSGKLYFVTNETQVGNDPPTPGLPPHSVALPYKARVLHGSLRYRAENSTFEARKGRAVAREIHLTNHFSVPIVIYSATLADPSFELDYFPAGHVLAASGGAAPPVHLRFTPNSSDLSFTTHMLVSSNVSMLSIPLHVYHGRLHYSIPGPSGHSVHTLGSRQELGKNVLDFGVLGVNEARARSFNITNPNPIGIDISSIITSLPETNLRLDCVLDLLGMPVQLGTNQDKDSAPKQLTGNPAVAGGSTDVRTWPSLALLRDHAIACVSLISGLHLPAGPRKRNHHPQGGGTCQGTHCARAGRCRRRHRGGVGYRAGPWTHCSLHCRAQCRPGAAWIGRGGCGHVQRKAFHPLALRVLGWELEHFAGYRSI